MTASSTKKGLSIDIETFSDVDLKKLGVYKYADSPNFQILWVAYAFDGEPVELFDATTGKPWPKELLEALEDRNTIKRAFNAQFERVCLNKALGVETGPWECTMVKGYSLGYAGSLATMGVMLGVDDDLLKSAAGTSLIKMFSVPKKPTKKDPRTRILPTEEPEKWLQFGEYCRQDVVAENAIWEALSVYDTPVKERLLYEIDQQVNDYGIGIDKAFCESAMRIHEELRAISFERFSALTGGINPRSPQRVKEWVHSETGEEVQSLTQSGLKDLQQRFCDHQEVIEALEIRTAVSKSSVKKYQTMLDTVHEDGRSRGNLQFFGAHTGRWAGRRIQLHNLPQNKLKDLDSARTIVSAGDASTLSFFYDDPFDVLRQCVRAAIVPEKGKVFVVADFSAIEARVLAWVAGEKWRLDVFNSHGKIYEASASQMFGVPIEEIHKTHPLRQKGKVAELALGYGGSVGALKSMGALKMGLAESELSPLVAKWRGANRNITRFWHAIEDAVHEVLKTNRKTRINDCLVVERGRLQDVVFTLPSGRGLYYPYMRLKNDSRLVFGALGETETYYGKLTENVVQAIARDLLADALIGIHAKGYKIAFHVHDEVVVEVEEDKVDEALKDVCAIMGITTGNYRGLPLKADGYICEFYQKD